MWLDTRGIATGGLSTGRSFEAGRGLTSPETLGNRNMALYAFDGTWNAAKDGDDPDPMNTNVVPFFQAYRKHSGTKDFYLDLVEDSDPVRRWLGEANPGK